MKGKYPYFFCYDVCGPIFRSNSPHVSPVSQLTFSKNLTLFNNLNSLPYFTTIKFTSLFYNSLLLILIQL